jgi:D-glycero-alpha-D-manno-heptose-7-phosphate kinase
VLSEQRAAIFDGKVTTAMIAMRDLAHELREVLGHGDVEGVGALLDRNWELKRSLASSLSDDQVDDWYRRARDAGASGGKLLGAGAGGFLLFMAAPERQAKVREALADMREVPFHFAARGTEITLLDRNPGQL